MTAQKKITERDFYKLLSPVFYSNLGAVADIVINQGGTSSTKTYSILQLAGFICSTQKGVSFRVVGESYPALSDGAMNDFADVLRSSEMLQRQIKQFNKNEKTYHFKNGSKLTFRTYDSEGSARSSGKVDYLYCNEINTWKKEIYLGLEDRAKIRTFIDYNSTHHFWVHDELIGEPNTVFFVSNFMSARAVKKNKKLGRWLISQKTLRRILSYKDGNKFRWQVYGLGRTGVIDSDRWLHTFDLESVRKKVIYNPDLPVYLSFDFNIGQMVAIAFQCSERQTDRHSFFYVLREFVEPNMTIKPFCIKIRHAYPTARFLVTGDQSGIKRDPGYSTSKDNAIAQVKEAFGLQKRQMLFGSYNDKYPKKNPSYFNSWLQCNNFLSGHPNFAVDESCTLLLSDMGKAMKDGKSKDDFKLYKGAGDSEWAMNALDTWRYALVAKASAYQKGGGVED